MDERIYNRIIARVSGESYDGREIGAPDVEIVQAYSRDDRFSDFTLRIKNTTLKYKLHKVIVCSQSEYFNAMFRGPWKETLSNSCDLELEEPLLEVFEGFVNFMYSGKVTMTLRDFWLYLILSDRYLVDSLQTACEDFVVQCLFVHVDKDSAHKEYDDGAYVSHIFPVHDICRSFTIDEVLEIYDAFASPRVKDMCAKNLLARVDTIPVATFLGLDVDVLCAMLQSRVCAIREEPLFQMVAKWVESAPGRKRFIVRLFSCIRFGDIAETHAIACLRHPLLIASRPISDHICACLYYSANRAQFRNLGNLPLFNYSRFMKRACLGHATI